MTAVGTRPVRLLAGAHFQWRREVTGVVVSSCVSCGDVVAKSRSEIAVHRAQRKHARGCLTAARSGPDDDSLDQLTD